MNAHPAGPKHAEQLQGPGLPDRPTSPEAFGELSPQVWPRNASRGDDGEVTLAGVKVKEHGEDVAITIGERQWRVRGLGRNTSFEA